MIQPAGAIKKFVWLLKLTKEEKRKTYDVKYLLIDKSIFYIQQEENMYSSY